VARDRDREKKSGVPACSAVALLCCFCRAIKLELKTKTAEKRHKETLLFSESYEPVLSFAAAAALFLKR
jgi:hypothetical protein